MKETMGAPRICFGCGTQARVAGSVHKALRNLLSVSFAFLVGS
jgi:hypothetical protein